MLIRHPWLKVLFMLTFAANSDAALGAGILCGSVFEVASRRGAAEVHEYLTDFDFINDAVLDQVIKRIDDDVHWDWHHRLNAIEPGEWRKVYLILRDGRELHFFEHQSEQLFVAAKFK